MLTRPHLIPNLGQTKQFPSYGRFDGNPDGNVTPKEPEKAGIGAKVSF
jgi:hypothetical protein